MKIKGIDISEHNGNINIQSIKDSGIAYAILRTGYGDTQAGRKDYKFDEYYAQAKKVGLPVGTYHYLYSTDPSQAAGEANNCINIMQGKKFEHAVWADFEDPSQKKLAPETCVDIIYNFCKAIRAAGYYTGWYTYLSFYNRIKTASNFNKLSGLDFWLANYNGLDNGGAKCDMWQYTSDGTVNGSSPRTDLNECYLDYPTIIKAKGLNGYQGGNTQAQPSAPSQQSSNSAGTKYKIGTVVRTNTLATSSTGGNVYKGDWQGKITKVVPNTPYPYLIGIDTGWTNDTGIDTQPLAPDAPQASKIEVGDWVGVRSGAKTYDGKGFGGVTGKVHYTADEIKGDRVVLDIPGICTAFNVKDLFK